MKSVRKKILTEAAGSPVSSYMLRAIKDAGYTPVASDVNYECAGSHLSDDFLIFPKFENEKSWEIIEKILKDKNIDLVIPTFDEMLVGWAERADRLNDSGISVLISPLKTIKTFQDKWLTAIFFEKNDLQCAKSSLEPIYPLIKPRFGRGSHGVFIEHNEKLRISKFKQDEMSQTILSGEEYTVDCLFNEHGEPLYIIPRKRLNVMNGKSTGGITVKSPLIEREVKRLAKATHFIGPINVQCFLDGDNVSFVEVNPRAAGGLALGMAASENWIPYFVDICSKEGGTDGSELVEPIWGLKMFRTYQEFFSL